MILIDEMVNMLIYLSRSKMFIGGLNWETTDRKMTDTLNPCMGH